MWETLDPEGRRIVLDEEAWTHILFDHDDLGCSPRDILCAVEDPDRRIPGRESHEEWFYTYGIGPSRWVKVVAHYEEDAGRIVTAFARRSFP